MSEIITESPYFCDEIKREEIRLRADAGVIAMYSLRRKNGLWFLHNGGYQYSSPLHHCPFCQQLLSCNQVEIT